jgi:hypothetical protein
MGRQNFGQNSVVQSAISREAQLVSDSFFQMINGFHFSTSPSKIDRSLFKAYLYRPSAVLTDTP